MKKLFLLLVAVITIGLCASAQTRAVKGTVLDANTDEPLIGASVTAKGSATGVATDVDGNFTLTVSAAVNKLTVSYVGYKTTDVTITPGNMVIKLHPEAGVLDEVIAVAYGSAKKSEYTGSASVVKAEQLEDVLVTTVTDALTGRVAGVQTLSYNGQPGSQPTVLVRGVGSINAGTQPLYVVDGVPYSGDIAGIPSTDIESMTVLKDAASAALYGARGANGVILITTKKGKEGNARVSLDARWGRNERALPNYDVITDPRQYIETVYKAHYMTGLMTQGYSAENSHQYALNQLWPSIGYQTWTAPAGQNIIGTDGKFNPNATHGYVNPANGLMYLGDNWAGQLQPGFREEYNLSVTGGTNKLDYYLGASYLGDGGIIPKSSYDRVSTRASVNYQAKPWLKLGSNISYTYVNMQAPGGQTSSGSSANTFVYANELAPVYPMYVRDAQGNIKYNTTYNRRIYDYGDGQFGAARNYMAIGNPAGTLAYDKVESLMDILDAKWYAVITPLEGLSITGSLGYFVDNTRGHSLGNPLYGGAVSYGGTASQSHSRLCTINEQLLVEYNRTFGNHSAGLMVGYESFSQNSESLSGNGQNLYNPNFWTINNTIDNRRSYGSVSDYATRGYLGRAKYNYASKYFFMASFRRDASSRFHPDRRWGNFWSASAAWDMKKENFLQDFSSLDLLKAKVSFGQNGNDNIGNYYAYVDQYTLTGADGVFNDAVLAYKGNPEITWETSNNFNAGFDFSFFRGALSGTVEYYQRQVHDMLFNIPTMPSLGYSSMPMNVGSMRNNGVELEVNYRPVETKDVTWDVFANLTLPSNKVLKLSPKILDDENKWLSGSRVFREGESMYQLYLVDYAGVDPKNGLALYVAKGNFYSIDGVPVLNKNGVPAVDADDKPVKPSDPNAVLNTNCEYLTFNQNQAYKTNRKSTGNLMPKGYGGFGTQVQAFNFDLAVNCSFQFGGRIMDNSYQSFMYGGYASRIGKNMHRDLLDAWTTPGQVTDVPRLSTTDQYTSSSSNRWLTSSNYLSLGTITAGYTLPENLVRKASLTKVRVYLSAENVALWSARKGLDPRQGFTESSNDTYSPIRCISGGVKLSF